MPAEMPDADDLVYRGDLLAAGVDDDQIARLIRARILARVRRGVYIPYEIWTALDAREKHLQRLRAALSSCRAPALASHVSAAAVHTTSLWSIKLDEVDLTRLDRRSGRREAGVRQHCGVLAPDDVTEVAGVPVTTATRTLLDVCSVLSVEQGLVVTEAVLHEGLSTPAALAARLERLPPWPGSLRVCQVLRLAQPRNTSVGESRAHYLFYRQSLPAPVPQYEIRDGSGVLVAVVDFAWPELGVFVEFDGRQKYDVLLRPGETAAQAVYREKLREDRIRELTGWTCIRLTWADLDHPERTAQRIRQAFARRAKSAS